MYGGIYTHYNHNIYMCICMEEYTYSMYKHLHNPVLYCTVLYCRIQGNLGHSNHLRQVKTIWDKLVDVGTSVLCNIVLYCSVEYRAIWDIPTIWDKSRQFGTS